MKQTSSPTSVVLRGIDDERVLMKRSMGVAVANVVLLAHLHHQHPRPSKSDLQQLALRRLALDKSHQIHAIMTALVQVHLHRYRVPYDLAEKETLADFLDAVCLDLSRYRNRRRVLRYLARCGVRKGTAIAIQPRC